MTGTSRRFVFAVSRQQKFKRRQPRVRSRSRSNRWMAALVSVGAVVLVLWAVFFGGNMGASMVQPRALSVALLRVEILREIVHDTTAYTQGLLWRDGWLYESTGQYGQSRLRRIDPKNGTVVQEIYTPPAFFGEGLATVGSHLIMLTWKAERAFSYDVTSFEPVQTFRYRGEGWGLCPDGDQDRLIMSNGSDSLSFRDPRTFEQRGAIRVKLRDRPLFQLNELACVGGLVYANVYQEQYLVAIDPETGQVTRQIDASGLLTTAEARNADVLNGIAFDPGSETFYITGKLWPKMFEVRFVSR